MAEIEKVIEEIQEQVDLCKEYFQRVNIFKDKSELEKLALKISIDGMQTLDVAIQTIRELQSESKEVCEWKFGKLENGYAFVCGCKKKIWDSLHEFEYCPYCGRKIKVVK